MSDTDDLIDQIEHIRAVNNKRWMSLVRLAINLDPVRAKKLLRQIADGDAEVIARTRELAAK